VNKTQQDEKDIIEQGMFSIMQMHSNATGTAEAKSWKNIYSDICALYHEELNSNKMADSVINEAPQKPPEELIHATSDSDDDDDDDDSDYVYVDTGNYKQQFLLFQDEEDSDDPEQTQNTLGNKSGIEIIDGIGSQDIRKDNY
jgi:hypothetical protein